LSLGSCGEPSSTGNVLPLTLSTICLMNETLIRDILRQLDQATILDTNTLLQTTHSIYRKTRTCTIESRDTDPVSSRVLLSLEHRIHCQITMVKRLPLLQITGHGSRNSDVSLRESRRVVCPIHSGESHNKAKGMPSPCTRCMYSQVSSTNANLVLGIQEPSSLERSSNQPAQDH
jgi:hypothetical protein